MIPSCFLEQVFKMGYVLVDHVSSHSIIGQFTICPLLQSCVGKGAMKFSTKLHPQSLVVGTMGRGYTIEDIAIALNIELFSLLQDPIINRRSSHK